MTHHALSERHQLCDLLDRLGPDAPTLCAGWETRDLAAHLVVREHRPDLFVASHLPFVGSWAERQQTQLAAGDYSELVDRVRRGAPAWSPLRITALDEMTNLVEYTIHHEDVRRAQPEWTTRQLSQDHERQLWAALRRMARVVLRSAPTGIVLVAEGVGRHSARLPGDHGTVVVRGGVLELVLFGYGRGQVADVQLDGAPEDVEVLRAARLGLT